jgi:hypothetical protein
LSECREKGGSALGDRFWEPTAATTEMGSFSGKQGVMYQNNNKAKKIGFRLNVFEE